MSQFATLPKGVQNAPLQLSSSLLRVTDRLTANAPGSMVFLESPALWREALNTTVKKKKADEINVH